MSGFWGGNGGASGVASVNTRTGAVTIGSPDISGALGFSPCGASHPHIIADTTGLQTALDGKQTSGAYLTSIDSTMVTTALGYTPVAPTRSISTTAPLAGGGDLSANRTFTISAATTSAAGSMSAADKTKLDGVATGATANATDAQLRDRSTHTGSQAESTITNLTTDLAAKAPLASPQFTGVTYYQQVAPTAKTTTGTLTIAELLTLIITCTSASAVSLTLPTGTLTDAGILSGALATNEAFEWYIINLGSSTGACTLVAGTNHTIVGNAVTAISTSSRWLTRKTANNTFVTYRLA